MIRFIFLLLILVVAVWLGLHIQTDPGYILLAWGDWTMEMPLWLGIILVVVAFILIYWLLRLFHFGGSMCGRMRLWSGRRRLRNAHSRTNRGLIDLAEGSWRRAEKNLIKSAENNETPLINYLAAAKAAQEQEAYERRDNYLKKAHEANPEAEIAIELTQAQLQMHHQQLEQALATLRHLRELSPNHKYVLKLLKCLYLELKDWHNLCDLLPQLRRYKILPAEDLMQLEHKLYKNLLEKAATSTDKSVDTLWKTIPKNLRTDSELVNFYCQHLINSQQNDAAEQLVKNTLKKHWHGELVNLYSLIPKVDRKKQLLTAEAWLKTHKKDPILLLTLGRLCKANQLWGKARSYLEASIGIKPSVEAYTELGQLLEHLNEMPLALDCYRKAISVK